MVRNISIFVVILAAAGAFLFRDSWLPLLQTVPDNAAEHDHDHGPSDTVKLSAAAQANLKLVAIPMSPTTYWRTLAIPGEVVERRGRGDQSFTAPVTGVVKAIVALPGDAVEPGAPLLTLRLTSEAMQASQLELFKSTLEMKIAQDQKKRLESVSDTVPQFQIIDAQNQLNRHAATKKAYRADLALKGLTPEQIDRVETGEFVREITVHAPVDPEGKSKTLFEVQELKVSLGDQVQAGHLLGLLSNHQNLYIEGHGFREDTQLLENTASAGWPVSAVFPEEIGAKWQPITTPFTILYLSNTVDPASQTLPFYVPLTNQYREYVRDGKTYRIWRFRPGQRVQLGVPVEEFKNVFVVPTAATARDGPEAYVFRQNGNRFERIAVRVLFEDSRSVVIANDGAIPQGTYLVQNAATAINRALKAQNAEEGGKQGGGHEH